MSKNLLVFQHIAREHPSNIAEYTAKRNIGLSVVKLWESQTIPPVADYDALVVLGGPMGVYEEYAGKREELSALDEAIGRMPVLGICLGAQLVAHAMGARVYPHIVEGKRIKEIGYYDVSLTPAGKQSKLFEGFSDTFKVLQWHGDTFDMPEGAEHLVTAPLCANQAFSREGAYGIQFHVEATPDLVTDWSDDDRVWTNTDFTLDEARVIREARELEDAMQKQCFRLMDNFLA